MDADPFIHVEDLYFLDANAYGRSSAPLLEGSSRFTHLDIPGANDSTWSGSACFSTIVPTLYNSPIVPS